MLKFHWRNSARLRRGVKVIMVELVLIAIVGGCVAVGFWIGWNKYQEISKADCDKKIKGIILDYQKIMQNNCEPLLIRQQMMLARQFESWIAPYNVWVAHLQEKLKACEESKL